MLISRIPARRAGLSLTEVLIAMFIMAIGMISLLVLFPYGALQMAQAIKDDRTAYAADTAHVHAMLFWQQIWQDHDPATYEIIYRDYAGAKLQQPALNAFENPDDPTGLGYSPSLVVTPGANPPIPLSTLNDTPPGVDSYPILIDPLGWQAHQKAINSTNGRDWVAGVQNPTYLDDRCHRRIARRTLKELVLPATAPLALRGVTLLDDISFSSLGSAFDPATGQVSRGGKYTWAYLLRRSAFDSFQKVNLTVLVFANRLVDNPTRETAYGATYLSNNTSMTVHFPFPNQPRPFIRKGGWIMDASRSVVNGQIIQNAKFYRVTQITETGTTYELELDRPIESKFDATTFAGPGNPNGGLIYVFDTDLDGRLVEVFDRGPISLKSAPSQ